MIEEMKGQFIDLLQEIGFVGTGVNHNENSENYNIIKACLVCGLYPNVLLVVEDNKGVAFHTAKDGQVFVHPSSMLFKDNGFTNKYVIYQEMVRTTKVYCRDLTMVTPYSLLLFGGHFDTDGDSGIVTVTLDKWIK
jgi:hypothetical protein